MPGNFERFECRGGLVISPLCHYATLSGRGAEGQRVPDEEEGGESWDALWVVGAWGRVVLMLLPMYCGFGIAGRLLNVLSSSR